jgi:hypothetical protein
MEKWDMLELIYEKEKLETQEEQGARESIVMKSDKKL